MRNIVILVMSMLAVTVFGAENFFEKEFPVEANAGFSLDSHKGLIKIRTDGGASIRVKAKLVGGDDNLAEYVTIETDSGSDFASVKVRYDHKSAQSMFKGLMGKGMTWPELHFDIILPDNCSLVVDSHKSEFDLEVPSRDIRIDSHKGTGRIVGVRSDLSLDTHKGSFEVEILELHDVNVDTHKGELNLVIHEARDFSVRGESHKGGFEFIGRDIEVKHKKNEITVTYREGNGDNRIALNTHKGHIKLEFVD